MVVPLRVDETTARTLDGAGNVACFQHGCFSDLGGDNVGGKSIVGLWPVVYWLITSRLAPFGPFEPVPFCGGAFGPMAACVPLVQYLLFDPAVKLVVLADC